MLTISMSIKYNNKKRNKTDKLVNLKLVNPKSTLEKMCMTFCTQLNNNRT